MKTLGLIIVCSVLGGCLGAMIGGGETTYLKKNQKESALPIFALGGCIIGAIGGMIIGGKITSEIKEETKLGFNTQETLKYKVGRKWEYETTFVNPATGNKNSIITAYSKEDDSVLTYFNDVPILNHDTKSGAANIIQKEHTMGTNYVRGKIKNSELNLI